MSSNTYTWPDTFPESAAQPAIAAPRPSLNSLFLAFWICCGVSFLFFLSGGELRHWFIVPVTLCGVLIGTDAMGWMRGEMDLFDPTGVMGLLGMHVFYLAPLLHVAWNSYMYAASPPEDWRPWLGGMAIINVFGIVIYQWTRGLVWKWSRSAESSIWKLRRKQFIRVIGSALVVTCATQVLIYARFGGISGYIDAYMSTPEAFEGTGWQFMISESFPILATIAFAVLVRAREWQLSSWTIGVVLAAFCGVQLLFGGLRGSRSNTVWALLWATGIIHFWLRPIRKSMLLSGLIFVGIFMYAYGFYKESGISHMDVAQSVELGKKRGRTVEAMLLGDFGRADVQAYVLYRLVSMGSDYEYAWGKTYLGALALLVPHSVWPERPATSVKAGTEAQHYMGAYQPKVKESSKVYGLAGETMLNFGPVVTPLAFAVFGLCVGYVQRLMQKLEALDSRRFLLPFLLALCFPILIGDSDNVVFFLVKQGFVPALVVFVSSKRQARGGLLCA